MRHEVGRCIYKNRYQKIYGKEKEGKEGFKKEGKEGTTPRIISARFKTTSQQCEVVLLKGSGKLRSMHAILATPAVVLSISNYGALR